MNKQELHRLIDTLPDSKLPVARAYLEGLRDGVGSGRSRSFEDFLNSAPYDDEELSPEEIAGIEEGLSDLKAGRVFTQEEIEREIFG